MGLSLKSPDTTAWTWPTWIPPQPLLMLIILLYRPSLLITIIWVSIKIPTSPVVSKAWLVPTLIVHCNVCEYMYVSIFSWIIKMGFLWVFENEKKRMQIVGFQESRVLLWRVQRYNTYTGWEGFLQFVDCVFILFFGGGASRLVFGSRIVFFCCFGMSGKFKFNLISIVWNSS